MAKRQFRKPAEPDDPVSAYARHAVSGEIIVGKLVRLACARHLRDLKRKDLVWDRDSAEHVIRYFRKVLRLSGGKFDGQPFELLPWAQFVVGSLFGWKMPDGLRRYQVAYVSTGKGSSKTPVLAGLGLYMTTADGEREAENFIAAAKKDQAMIPFRDAVRMRDKSPELKTRLRTSGGVQREWNLAHLESGSFLRPISSEDSQSGPRVHFAGIDELHEHRTSQTVEMMRAGTKQRAQPLIFMITNAGHDRASVCWAEHEYAKKVLEGQLENDRHFAFIASLDDGDLPEEVDPIEHLLAHEELWPKANPGLPQCPGPEYIRQQLVNARGKPTSTNTTLRLNFSVWTQSSEVWIPAERWDACDLGPIDPKELRYEPCYGGLDLSATTDFSAWALAFPRAGGRVDTLYRLWVPEASIDRRQLLKIREHIRDWGRRGLLTIVPGDTIDFDLIEQEILEDAARFDIREIGYDRSRATGTVNRLVANGLSLVPIGQNFTDLTSPMQDLEARVNRRALNHGGHPVLAWMMSCCVATRNPQSQIRYDKARSSERIDGVSALVMALFCLGRHAGEGAGDSVYDERVARGEPALLSF
jgi:phage terminase large subunit-like protein